MATFKRDKVYEEQILLHHKKALFLLNDFNKKTGEWTDIEYYAVERILQMFVEALIGLSRYVVQTRYQVPISRSKDAIRFLRERNEIPSSDFETLMKVIGFRHVLVHDYLEVDRKLVRSIVLKKDYQIIDDWFMTWHGALQKD